ncbi:hypothetical protein QTP88_009620 [Uroleucon formosanum]
MRSQYKERRCGGGSGNTGYRRLIRTGPGQSGANVTTESLKSRRHAASADVPYLFGAPKPSLSADAGVADANRPPNPIHPTPSMPPSRRHH